MARVIQLNSPEHPDFKKAKAETKAAVEAKAETKAEVKNEPATKK